MRRYLGIRHREISTATCGLLNLKKIQFELVKVISQNYASVNVCLTPMNQLVDSDIEKVCNLSVGWLFGRSRRVLSQTY